MYKYKIAGLMNIIVLIIMVFVLSACSGTKQTTTTQNDPLPSPGAGVEDNPEITENIDSIINDLIASLGPPPEDVVGFGAGYRRKTAITPTENTALLKLYREKSNVFAYYNMNCSPSVTADDMLTYDPAGENNKKTGYGIGNNSWTGKSGFTRYDSLGNLDASIKKTAIDLVSINKTVKTGAADAQAFIDRGSIYAYWIISLPDDNNLDGTVFDKGADDKLEPVKKGMLRFKRVGPGPSKVDTKVTVNGNGKYKTEGELTAGHYEVSFDAKDGKGEKVLNKNWLYIPGDTPTQDWVVLVRNTYEIIYDRTHNSIGSGIKPFDVHMEWHDIPIDWTVESDKALELGLMSSYKEMYCLTYEYFDNNPAQKERLDDSDDESEAESTPGYSPSVIKEDSQAMDGFAVKITQKPTLAFFRAAKDSSYYLKDAYYICIDYSTSLVGQGQVIDYPADGLLLPLPFASENTFEQQGWEELSKGGRLEEKAIKALIEEGKTYEFHWTDKPPKTEKIHLVIRPQK